jgi:hypothetical protein
MILHKILVVAEGEINFNGTDYHSLSPMLDRVHGWSCQHGGQDHNFEVVRLQFSNGAEMLSKLKSEACDQLWLFGQSDPATPGASLLKQAERDELGAMMDAGALGVFATGDHAEVGAPLCGDLRRVRFLRRWRWHANPDFSVPSKDNSDRAETLVPALFPDPGVRFEDDSMPKTIWSRNQSFDGTISPEAHQLCFHPDYGRISFLPDHMHEGMCMEPMALAAAGIKPDIGEFPADSVPEIVAWSVRTGIPGGMLPPSPSVFPVISCFDHTTMGRIVVDSTFHHWLWGNVGNLDVTYNLGWRHVRQYPRNVAAWLARIHQVAQPVDLVVGRLSSRTEVLDALIASEADPSDANFAALGAALERTATNMRMDVGRVRALLKQHAGSKSLHMHEALYGRGFAAVATRSRQ